MSFILRLDFVIWLWSRVHGAHECGFTIYSLPLLRGQTLSLVLG